MTGKLSRHWSFCILFVYGELSIRTLDWGPTCCTLGHDPHLLQIYLKTVWLWCLWEYVNYPLNVVDVTRCDYCIIGKCQLSDECCLGVTFLTALWCFESVNVGWRVCSYSHCGWAVPESVMEYSCQVCLRRGSLISRISVSVSCWQRMSSVRLHRVWPELSPLRDHSNEVTGAPVFRYQLPESIPPTV